MKHSDLERHVGKYYGKYAGEVIANDNDDNLSGQIEVTVPGIFGTDVTVFAHPCFPSSHFFVPPVGAKVWIEFEAGDPNYPLWVGVWYPQKEVPLEAQKTPPTSRVIQTPSGHTIELSDEEGEEKIVIRHQGDSFLSIDSDGSVLVSNQNGSHLFLNADAGDAVFMQEDGNYLRMSDEGVVMVNQEGGATLQLSGSTARLMAENIILEGATVAVGAGAASAPPEPAVLGQTFANMWNQFITAYAAHTHATGAGPSGPPLPPLIPPPVLGSPPLGQGLATSTVVK